ncbi:MAG: hypothetical protein V4727_07965 [Verrucomicrobiota bacterium]
MREELLLVLGVIIQNYKIVMKIKKLLPALMVFAIAGCLHVSQGDDKIPNKNKLPGKK